VSATDLRDVRMAQLEGSDWAAAASGAWHSAEALWPFMRDQTNHVRAARTMRWDEVLPDGAAVLDLGCGPGWLTAMLSAEERVARVIAWDSSHHLLSEVLPPMIELAGGDIAKIERVCGDFVPLLLDDGAVDAVVMGSAFHHAEDPDALLAEIRRVLAPGGPLVLLNETPWRPVRMLAFATRHFVSTALGVVGLPGPRAPGALTHDGALYDPVLGDRAYTLRGWQRIAARNGWSLRERSTGLPPYPRHQRRRAFLEPDLHHLILRPEAPAARRTGP
jgi:SAM-dependent methyltransferase